MEQEKIEKIKKVLEQNTKTCLLYDFEKNTDCKVFQCKDILIYINELESENERLTKQYVDWKDLYGENTKRVKKLKDRIALLEKDNELLRNAKVVYENVDYCYEDLKKAEKRIAELEKENSTKTDTIVDLLKKQEFYEKEKLKQFAERLKEEGFVIFMGDIIIRGSKVDEVLKEFLGEK